MRNSGKGHTGGQLLETVDKENNPKTGNQIMTWLSLGIISLIGLTGTLVYRKRYNK